MSPQVRTRRHCGHFCACACSLKCRAQRSWSSVVWRVKHSINHHVVRDLLLATRPPTNVLRTTTPLLVAVRESRIISMLSGQLPLSRTASLHDHVFFTFCLNTSNKSASDTNIHINVHVGPIFLHQYQDYWVHTTLMIK